MQAPQKQITQASIAIQIRGRSFLDSPERYFKNKEFSLSISLMKPTYLFYNKPVYLVLGRNSSTKVAARNWLVFLNPLKDRAIAYFGMQFLIISMSKERTSLSSYQTMKSSALTR